MVKSLQPILLWQFKEKFTTDKKPIIYGHVKRPTEKTESTISEDCSELLLLWQNG